MKQENYRNKRKLNAITTALSANFLYIIIVLIFKGILDLMGNDGNYGVVFGVIELVLVSIYFIAFNWLSFQNASEENSKEYGRFLLLEMIPITVLTIASIVLIYVGDGGSFSADWNAMTFIIAPSLFWFLPFGLVYHFMSGMMPIAIFMVTCIVYIIVLQCIGYAMGAKSRATVREREKKRVIQEKQYMIQQSEMARQASRSIEENRSQPQSAVAQNSSPRDERDPLKDVDQPAIIQTEAFSSITDEMIEEAIRNQKIKTAAQKRSARHQQGSGAPNAAPKKRTTMSKQRNQTRDISKELESIRRKIGEKDEK